VRTVGDIAALSEEALVAALGNAAGRHLHARAWNRDDRAVEPEHTVKSVGHEETFPTDISDRAVLSHEIVKLADRVAARLRAAGRTGRTIQLKVRFADFRTITRSKTLAAATDLGAEIAQVARALLDSVPVAGGIRLLGVSAQQLEGGQPQLFDDPGESRARQTAVERSLDAVRARFGSDAIGPGATNSLPREGSEPPAR
jgi:DNA polymerase-4